MALLLGLVGIMTFFNTRIVTYYVGLSSLGLWGFNFFETLSFYLNQKVSAIFILSESKTLIHFYFHMDS